MSLTGSPVEFFPGIELPFAFIASWCKTSPFSIFQKKANGVQLYVSSEHVSSGQALGRHPRTYSLALAALPVYTSQALHLPTPALLSCDCRSWWSFRPRVCDPVHLSSGFCGWEQTRWACWPSAPHTSPHYHPHVSQGRNHSNCWNLVSGDPFQFLVRLFDLACTCFLYVCSMHYWPVVFSESRQSINFNKWSSRRCDLTHSFIYQFLFKEAPVLG